MNFYSYLFHRSKSPTARVVGDEASEVNMDEHMKQYHKKGFNPDKDTCKYWKAAQEKDKADVVSPSSPPNQTSNEESAYKEGKPSLLSTPWREDFPNVIVHTTRQFVATKYGEDFAKAKAGDTEAAKRLVKGCVKSAKIMQLAEDFPEAILVPVHAEEATGMNQIPVVYARCIGEIGGMEANLDIVQSVRAKRTGKDATYRLFNTPEFRGRVEKGKDYIIVDDHITQGGTINALRDYIEKRGGKVVAATTLTFSRESTIIKPRKETIDNVREKIPGIDRLLREAGIAESCEALTESQLKYIKRFSLNSFRDKLAEGKLEGVME